MSARTLFRRLLHDTDLYNTVAACFGIGLALVLATVGPLLWTTYHP